MKKIVFKHGKPANDKYFTIAIPYNGKTTSYYINDEDGYRRADLEDPRTGEKMEVEIIDMWRFDTADFEFLDALMRLTYGLTGRQVLAYMRKKYKFSFDKIDVFLLKQI